jgi:4-hydroxythreonine-4-phosphate dehydrogenase
VRRAFASRSAKRAALLFKKIDSTLRGHVAAELAAARRMLGRRAVLFSPAFPAQGRTVADARLRLDGKPASGDLRALLAKAGLPATHIDLRTVRSAGLAGALRAAIATGARALACDALRDADLDALARAGLALRPRPVFVGSAGLARALARTLPRRKPAAWQRMQQRPVVTVVGSASPVSRLQVQELAQRRAKGPIFAIEWTHEPTRRDLPRVRNLGRMAARVASAHFVLTGGETARAVLGARGIRALRLLGEVEPGVPFAMARDGTLVCTKAGAFGGPATLAKCVARLKREMTRS